MSKEKRAPDTRTLPRQTSLLDAIAVAEALRARDETPAGANSDLEMRVGRSLAAYFRQPGAKGRYDVAGRISEDLQRSVSKDMLDKFTSEAAPHHIPVDVVTSFAKVTGWRQPLDLLAEAAGLFCLPGPEALRAEIQRFDEAERRARAEKRRRLVFLKNMEGTR